MGHHGKSHLPMFDCLREQMISETPSHWLEPWNVYGSRIDVLLLELYSYCVVF